MNKKTRTITGCKKNVGDQGPSFPLDEDDILPFVMIYQPRRGGGRLGIPHEYVVLYFIQL